MAAHEKWMPLYIADYLADTMHLTTRQHGAYLLLLMHAWRSEGFIPLKHEQQASIVRMTPAEWSKEATSVLDFFEHAEDRDALMHARVQKELSVAKAVTQQRSGAGKASAAKRERDRQRNPNGNSTLVERPLDSRTAPSPLPSHNSEAKASGAAAPQDPVKALFDDGVKLLTENGCRPDNARSLVGKWRKEHGDEATQAAFKAARAEGVTEPIAWITQRFAGKPRETWNERRIRLGMEAISDDRH